MVAQEKGRTDGRTETNKWTERQTDEETDKCKTVMLMTMVTGYYQASM